MEILSAQLILPLGMKPSSCQRIQAPLVVELYLLLIGPAAVAGYG